MGDRVGGQGEFELHAPVLERGSDPAGASGNRIPLRRRTIQQNVPRHMSTATGDYPAIRDRGGDVTFTTINGVLSNYTVPATAVRATASFTVNNNDFTVPAEVQIGNVILISGEDFTPGGTTDLTATAIALAITNLDGYDASAVGSNITIQGLTGLQGNYVLFDARSYGAVINFTNVPVLRRFSGGEPVLGPPTIIP